MQNTNSKKLSKQNLTEQTQKIAFKIERVMTLMELLERGLEHEYETEQRKLASLSYTISDYLSEIKENFAKLENLIVGD